MGPLGPVVGEMRDTQKTFPENLKGIDQLGDLGVGWRIILKQIFNSLRRAGGCGLDSSGCA
jgi:hypothetical protein